MSVNCSIISIIITAAKNAIFLIDRKTHKNPKSKDVFDIAGALLSETAVVYFTTKSVC